MAEGKIHSRDTKIIHANLPSVTNTNTKIYNDSSLFGKYIIAGFQAAFGDAYISWQYNAVVKELRLQSDGIYCTLLADAAKNYDIHIVLIKR